MIRNSLKQILGAQNGLRPVIESLAQAMGAPIAVEDAAGGSLFGVAGGGERLSVAHEGKQLGWVSGLAGAEAVADLLRFMVAKEAERKALGTEVLHLYREVNLIYSFSEKLAALLDLERVAQLTLQEARHLIVATDGAILLLDEPSDALTSAAAFGDELPGVSGFARGKGIAGTVAATGVGEKVIGVIVLASTQPMAYEARELKLLNTLALQTATAIENARLFERTVQAGHERERLLALNQEAEVARAGYERELSLAATIQADLFPAQLPALPGYDLAARSRPARRCGGDYYDAIPIVSATDPDAVLLCVADVSGKGLPAALLMSHMQATLRALLGRTASLQELAGHAHDLLHGSTADNKYVTAALVKLDPATGRASYVSAGHINSLVVTRSGDVVPLGSTGAPLGLLPPGLPYDTTMIDLRPGDCLVLCSDGVPDAQNEAGDEFGEARLTAIDACAGVAPQFDDITLLVFRRLASIGCPS